MDKNAQHNPATDPVKAQDWNDAVAGLDNPVLSAETHEKALAAAKKLRDEQDDDREMLIPLEDLPPHIFDDFSEYTAGLRHLKDGPISRMRRRSFLSGLIIGLLTSSLIWFIMLVAYGVIIR